MVIRTVGDVVRNRPFGSVLPGQSLREACREMRRAGDGALAVMEEGALCGILCETDVIHRAVCEGLPMDGTAVSEVMSRGPEVIDASDSVAAALQAMYEGGFRHLPVLEGALVIGILSMRDIPTEYRYMAERFAQAQTGPRPLAERGYRLL
ncbi:cyclic nucleotide-binding/CBS domain-containing protein [Mangrovicoccus sp. HB161399]|uniref:CBS domain-containing protein n=1 Tax=Mangrovicoccus sp. HB161399 TaxID=2720392 RepID=UPI001553F9B7|nr:CBS domain-containing protein [Mangrovicoccus sp. HB161399]